jgi:hypothetical protein
MRIVRRSFGIVEGSLDGRTESFHDREQIVFSRSRIVGRSRKSTQRKSFDFNSLVNARGRDRMSAGRFQLLQVPVPTKLTLPQPFRSILQVSSTVLSGPAEGRSFPFSCTQSIKATHERCRRLVATVSWQAYGRTANEVPSV